MKKLTKIDLGNLVVFIDLEDITKIEYNKEVKTTYVYYSEVKIYINDGTTYLKRFQHQGRIESQSAREDKIDNFINSLISC